MQAEILERLARLEARVEQTLDELSGQRQLMERLVRIEEQRDHDSEALRRTTERVEALEGRLEEVASLRRAAHWALALATGITITVMVRMVAAMAAGG